LNDAELAAHLQGLDWGSAAPQVSQGAREDEGGVLELSRLDVGVAGVAPRKEKVRAARRSHHKAVAPAVSAAAAEPEPDSSSSAARSRRPKDTPPDILAARAESPAVIALFESMWKEVGHGLAVEAGRPKASRQDAALGWYMLLLAMRKRDARNGT
jgi:hypothetical protein